MDKKQFLILFLVSLIPLSMHLIRNDITGVDSFAYLNYVCHKSPILPLSPPLATWFFSIMPCNILLIKIQMWLFLLASTLIAAKIGELFSKEHGWLCGIFIYLGLAFVFQSFEWENDHLAYPFMFAAMYFYFKWKMQSKFRIDLNLAAAIGLLLFAGWGLWGGAVFYLLTFAAGSYAVAIVAVPLLILHWGSITGALLPSMKVAEQIPLLGFISLLVLLVGYFRLPKIIRKETFIITAFGLVVSKYIILLVPFLAVGLLHLALNLHEIRIGRLIIDSNTIKLTGALMMTIIIVGSSVNLLYHWPKPIHWEVSRAAVEYQKQYNLPLDNDWSLGYYLEYSGGTTKFKGSYPQPDWNHSRDAIAVVPSEVNFNNPHCTLLKDFNNAWGIYKCT